MLCMLCDGDQVVCKEGRQALKRPTVKRRPANRHTHVCSALYDWTTELPLQSFHCLGLCNDEHVMWRLSIEI